MSVIDSIMESMGGQLLSLTEKVQNFLDTADLSNPAMATKLQMFSNQLSVYTNLNSTMIKVFGDMAKSTIHNML